MSAAKRKAYAVTIVAGLLALVGERLVGSGATETPAPASASERSSRAMVPAGSASPRPTPDVEPARFPRVPANLPMGGPLRDPFAIEKPVRRLLGAMDGDADRDAGEAAPRSAEAFVSQHRLSAVMKADEVVIAVVDGELVRPGQTVDGWTLRQIQGSVAVFQCGDKTARLTMEIGSKPGGGR
jgi:hypothetical protein